MPTPGLLCDSDGLLTTDEEGLLLLGETGDPCCCTEQPCGCGPRFAWGWFACPVGTEQRGSAGAMVVTHQASGTYLQEWPDGRRLERSFTANNAFCVRANAVTHLGGTQQWETITVDANGVRNVYSGNTPPTRVGEEPWPAYLIWNLGREIEPDAPIDLVPTFNLNLIRDGVVGDYLPGSAVTAPSGLEAATLYRAAIPGYWSVGRGGPLDLNRFGQFGNRVAYAGHPIEPPFLPTCVRVRDRVVPPQFQPIYVSHVLTDSTRGGTLTHEVEVPRPPNGSDPSAITATYEAAWQRLPLACPDDPVPGPTTRQDGAFPNPDLERLLGLGLDPATLRPVVGKCAGCGE